MLTRRAMRPWLLRACRFCPRSGFAADRVRMFELYKDDRASRHARRNSRDKLVEIQGFMAPHLEGCVNFFILSNTPVETCPFCATEGDWIDSIVFVRMMKRERRSSQAVCSNTVGRLEIGAETDAETGFVSRAGSSTLSSGLHDRH